MRSKLVVTAAVVLVLPLAACKGKKGGSSTGETMGAATPLPPIDLKPLPDAPVIQVKPEDLPGSDGSLAVVAARPQGKAYGNFRPTITFTRPVVAMGTIESSAADKQPARIDPPIEGEWKWLGSTSLEFVAKGLVPYATKFTVTVPAGLASLDGAMLKKDYVFSFETPAPEIQRVEPQNGFLWMKPDNAMTVLFNQPVADFASKANLTVNGQSWPLKVLKEVDVAQELRDAEKAASQKQQGEGEAGTRTYERHDFATFGFKNEQTRYELAPGQPMPLDAAVKLTIDGSIAGKQGPITMGLDRSYEWKTYGKMEIRDLAACSEDGGRCSYGPLVVFTSNKPDVESVKKVISIEPKVELDWDHAEASLPVPWMQRQDPFVTIPGKFRPGTTYHVSFAAGMKDEFGQSAPAFQGQISTDDLEPSFNVGSNEALLEAKGDGAIPVEFANIHSLSTTLWTMTPSQMAAFVAGDRYGTSHVPPGMPQQTSVALNAKKNVDATRPLVIRDLLPTKKTGLFFARFTAPEVREQWQRTRTVTGQITDLAVHAKLGATSGLVWVTRLSDGSSVGDADLALYDRGGVEKWHGKTSADGLAKVPGLSELVPTEDGKGSWSTPFALVSATKDGDTGVTLSSWTGGFSAWSWSLPQDWDGKHPKSLGFVIADRGIYRPGDTVYLKGLARYRQLGVIKTPGSDSKINLHVQGSQGNEVFSQTLPLTDYGTYSASFQVPADAPLGTYEVSAGGNVGGETITYGGSFRVEEYRPPQFKVDVTAPKADFASGDALSGTVLARYLFGGAMAGADVKWTINRNTTFFTPPGNEGFAFGNNIWGWNDEEPSESSDIFASGEGKTDNLGVLDVTPGKAEAPGDRPWSYTLEAEVSDVSRQRMANRVSWTVHPAAVYAGIRQRSTGFAEVGKAVPLEIVAVDPAGARQEDVKVAVKIQRREWKFIRKKGVGDRWYTETQEVDADVASCDIRTAKTPKECSFTPKEPGFYVLSATATDAQGRNSTTRDSTYVIGSGWVSWQRNDTDRIDLVADKTLYDVGDTAKILVKSPYPEADAVLTVEREGVLSSKRIHLKGSAESLAVPIDESLIPNAFVSVVLVRGRVADKDGLETGDDPGRPAVRVGYAQIKVEKKSKRLNVAVTPDAKEKRPGQKVKVDVAVTDWKGKPSAATEVAVWAVDDGVLRLTDYQVPDPIAAIHPDRGLSVRIGEPLLNLVQRKKYGDKGEGSGGSGGNDSTGSGIRKNFKTTVLFAPAAITDGSGHAHVEFDLPDNLTTFRIMAMAVTKEDRFGSGQSEVVVSKPLLALPALPRLARVGDDFEAGVVVHSPGAKVNRVNVAAEVTGLTLEGPGSQDVAMGDGKPKEIRFHFRADAPGEATLTFRIQGGGESDAVQQKIPVKLPVPLEAVAVYGDTKDKRTEGLLPPGGVRPDAGGLDVSMASTVMGGFDENMRQLVDYPYGCLEQMSSRLIPFVELRKLHSKFHVAYTGPDDKKLKATEQEDAWIRSWLGGDSLDIYGTRDPDVVIRKTIASIEKLQNHDGGFRYWENSSCSDDWASSYAVLVLQRAKDVGYDVDDGVVSRGQDFLANTVAAGQCVRCSWYCTPPDDTTRVNALYALARTGKPKASYYPELFQRRAKLPLFGQAELADAMFVGGGDRAQAKVLFQELLNHAKESAKEVHFEETDPLTYATKWSSDPRTTAIVLQTLTDIAPDHPYVSKIGSYLTTVRKGNGRYRNTQEAAFALMALSEVVATKEKDTPDYKATVTLGKQILAQESFKGRSMDVKKTHLDMAKLASLGAAQLPFEFAKEGAGVLYYGALLRYAPKEMPTTPLDRGMIVQRWFEPWQGGGQITTVRAGELVRVRVRVGTHMERQYVAVDVPLPSGLEPVDTSLATTAQLPRSRSQEATNRYEYESDEDTYADGRGEGEYGEGDYQDDEGNYGGEESFDQYAGWFWSPFNHTEQRDDRVVLFADHLPPGVHTASFVARATTPGTFVMKPAQAEEMYSPETFGRSDGGTFRVVESNEVAGK